MRLAVLLGLLCLAASAAWLSLDRVALDLGQQALVEYGLDDLIAFDALAVEDGGARLQLTGARLLDPQSGLPVGHVRDLSVSLTRPRVHDEPPRVLGLHGSGGRLRLDFEQDELVVVRVIAALVHRIMALGGDGPRAPMPPLVFEDVEVVLGGEGWPLQRVEGVSATVTDAGDAIVVDGALGGGGTLRLELDGHGLRRLSGRRLPFRPPASQFVPRVDEFLGRMLAPEGLLDLDVEVQDGEPLVTGTLRDAVLRPPVFSFPLGPATIPFRYEDERVEVGAAEVAYDGGVAQLSVSGTPDDFLLELHVERSVFREDFLRLVPAYRDLSFLSCEDGGRFELSLRFPVRAEQVVVSELSGGGGFHVPRVRFDPPGLVFEDVVGRLVVDGELLRLQEVFARLAGGGVQGSGYLHALSGDWRTDLVVEDVDVARLDLYELLDLSADRRRVEGWLQGELTSYGKIGDPRTIRGAGQVSIRAADLWRTRLVEALLLALPFTGQAGGRQGVSFDYEIANERVRLRNVRLRSDLFTLLGSGSVGFDQRLDLEFRIAVPLGLLGRAVEVFQQRFLLNLVVGGRLSEPVVVARPLDVVTGPLARAWAALTGSDEPEPPAPAEEEAVPGPQVPPPAPLHAPSTPGELPSSPARSDDA